MTQLAPFRTVDFRTQSFGAEACAIASDPVDAVALERQFAEQSLPWRLCAPLIFLSAIFCYASGFGLFVLASRLITS